jgi:LCP family protein required for cell wall assembly
LNADKRPKGPHQRSPSLAIVLSFLWPGLGQWYAGRPGSALIYAVPIAGALAILVASAAEGIEQLTLALFAPSFALTTVVLVILLGLWRVIAMVDAASAARPGSLQRPSIAGAFAALSLAVVLSHGTVAYYAWAFYDAGSKIFVSDEDPDRTPFPAATGHVSDFQATPAATPVTVQSRVNILLTGIDSSEQRDHALTDTLIVVSIDPAGRTAAMISFPRDIAQVKLSDGRVFKGRINELMGYAMERPERFPEGGLPTLIRELGHILGVPIHYYAAIDLDGFRRMVDLVGGVDIVNDRAISDPVYGGWTDGRPIGFHLSKGPHHLDGDTALAYVRSRKGVGDNDFTRARRQQQVLVALQKKMTDPAMVPLLPEVLDAAAGTISTNFPPGRLGEFLAIGRDIDESAIHRYVLGPPYAERIEDADRYMLELDFDRVARLSVDLFGDESLYAKAARP